MKLLSPADRHLAGRWSYGLTPALARDVRRSGGGAAWWDQQVRRPGRVPDRPAQAVRAWWPDLDRGPADLWRREQEQVRGGWEVMGDYGRWLLVRRMLTRRPVLEKMTEFWESLLHVPVNGDPHFTWRVDYGDTIRRHALGRYDRLLTAAITHPAMLISLSAATSTKVAPNENLGRELLELHTVGLGNHDESDVKDSARILTGWHVDLWRSWAASYRPEDHATGAVRVGTFSHPNTDPDGRAVTRAYLRHLAHHPDTARRVCHRLATKFVHDDPPAALVRRLARVYVRNDTAIVPVLRELVASKEFRGSARAKLRDPSEDVVATYRALGVKLRRPTRAESGANAVLWQAESIGLSPHAWPRPDGTPVTDQAWATPARALASINVHWSLAGGWWPKRDTTFRPARTWVPARGSIRFSALVDDLSREMLHRPATAWLQRTAQIATGYGPRERITREHPLVRWQFARLLAAILDSPDHLAC